MYSLVLTIHSLIRWIVVIIGLITIVRAFYGWFGNRQREPLDDQLGLIYTTSMDLQLLLGLLLYFFLSPITTGAFRDMGTAMGNSGIRFWAVEHILMMIIAVILAHVGRWQTKKGVDDRAKQRRAAIWYGLSFVVLFLAIPWPFLPFNPSRPWLPLP